MATIKLKRSSSAGAEPTTGNLELGELAVNTHDGRIYFEQDDGTARIARIEVRREGTAEPTAGRWRAGEIQWNSAPSVHSNNLVLLGWLCLTSGTFGATNPTFTPIYTLADNAIYPTS